MYTYGRVVIYIYAMDVMIENEIDDSSDKHSRDDCDGMYMAGMTR